MANGRLLVVAPENDLRRSLVFALGAEGYAVTVLDAPPPLQWLADNRFDCTVLDQHALTGAREDDIAFCTRAQRVVLLASRVHPWLVEWVTEIVELPPAGEALSAAIGRALDIAA